MKEVEQLLAEAQKNVNTSKAYFNFLLNRQYDQDIDPIEDTELIKTAMGIEEATRVAGQSREEIQQLNYFMAASDNNIRLSKGNFLPNINLVADYGIQGTRYTFNRDADFAMGSLVMSWNLFDWTTRSKVQQAQIEKQEVAKQKEELQRQIDLQVVNGFYDLETALKQIELAGAEVEAAQKAFRLVNKKYSQGQANLVELTNARTQMTNAEQNLILVKFDYQVKQANFERVAGLYRFN